MLLYDVAGTAGALMIVGAYFLLQIERLDPKGLAFSGLNALGAALILVSLTQAFNLAATVVELFWLAVSAVGLYRYATRRTKSADTS